MASRGSAALLAAASVASFFGRLLPFTVLEGSLRSAGHAQGRAVIAGNGAAQAMLHCKGLLGPHHERVATHVGGD